MATAIDHIEAIEALVYRAIFSPADGPDWHNVVYRGAAHSEDGTAALAHRAPWNRNDQQAMNRDTDGDGIPDALDGHFGQGAVDPFDH